MKHLLILLSLTMILMACSTTKQGQVITKKYEPAKIASMMQFIVNLIDKAYSNKFENVEESRLDSVIEDTRTKILELLQGTNTPGMHVEIDIKNNEPV